MKYGLSDRYASNWTNKNNERERWRKKMERMKGKKKWCSTSTQYHWHSSLSLKSFSNNTANNNNNGIAYNLYSCFHHSFFFTCGTFILKQEKRSWNSYIARCTFFTSNWKLICMTYTTANIFSLLETTKKFQLMSMRFYQIVPIVCRFNLNLLYVLRRPTIAFWVRVKI